MRIVVPESEDTRKPLKLDDPGPWLTVKEAAPYVGVPWKRLQEMCTAKEITCRRASGQSGRYLLSPAQINGYLRRTTQPAEYTARGRAW